MPQLIINADDFGLLKSVNDGIIKAHCEGILTSTTIMANMPHFDDAVSLAKKFPELGVGIHLNILRGVPVSALNKIPTLIGDDELFFNSIPKLVFKLFSKQINLNDIRLEYRNQIEKVIENGLKPTHLDSEKHHHTLPSIFPLVLELAKYFSINKVRYVNERPFTKLSLKEISNTQFYKARLISFLSNYHKEKIEKLGFKTVDGFYGIGITGKMTPQIVNSFLENLGEGTFEFMCHPGLPEKNSTSPINIGKYFNAQYRPIELDVLLQDQLKETIKQKQIQLIHYGQLSY